MISNNYSETEIQNTNLKKKIIFLFSGQSRISPFSNNIHSRNNDILNSYNELIFTDKFKELYDYKIYITTDDIHLEDTINYFSLNNIGNIHLLNSDYYLKPIENKLKPVDEYINIYNNKDWSHHVKYDNSIHQHYKVLDSYNLFSNDANLENCDYIVRLRMDLKFPMNMMDTIELLQNTKLEIVISWDMFAVGTSSIMKCYCNGLNNNYGNYHYNTNVPEILPMMINYHIVDRCIWTYAPERQLFEMLFEYCNQNNLDINETIKDVFIH
jgi:hypothetical protein